MLLDDMNATVKAMELECFAAWQAGRITSEEYWAAVDELDYLLDVWAGPHV